MPIKKKPSLDSSLFSAYAIMWHEAGNTVQKRFYILRYWHNFGLEKTIKNYNVSKSTLYRWRSRLTKGGLSGLSELSPLPTIPKNKRKPAIWPQEVLNEITMLKVIYPNIGRQQLHYMVKCFCEPRHLPCPCPSSIVRLIKNRMPHYKAVNGPLINPALLISYYRESQNNK